MIGAAEAQSFLATKSVKLLPGVGPAMADSLAKAGYTLIGDLARADPKTLAKRWNAYGLRLYELAHGRDARAVDPDSARKTISAETTFNDDLRSIEDLEDRLWPACEKVASRLRAEGLAGRVATLKLKTPDFRLITRRRTLPAPIQTARMLFAAARDMLRVEATGGAFRLIGAGLADLVEASDAEVDLFDEGEARARKTEKSLDSLRARFGKHAVMSGRALRGMRDD